MHAEVVAERELILESRRASGNEVQMMCAPTRSGLAEPVHLAASIGEVDVAESRERIEARTRTAESSTPARMSITGFASKPGTAVLPTWWIPPTTQSPIAPPMPRAPARSAQATSRRSRRSAPARRSRRAPLRMSRWDVRPAPRQQVRSSPGAPREARVREAQTRPGQRSRSFRADRARLIAPPLRAHAPVQSRTRREERLVPG